LTVDCVAPRELAAFWAEALGYVSTPVPVGYASWDSWFDELGVSLADRDSGAFISHPDGTAPGISFLQVPEPKLGKNRLHIDLRVGGGRHLPWEHRWAKVQAEVERLTALGASLLTEVADEGTGRPDHVVMADPEGNEFCVV
jgi:hypothetical protein